MLPTPGAVTRRLIRDMLWNAKVWQIEHCEAVSRLVKGGQTTVIRVCGRTGIVTISKVLP